MARDRMTKAEAESRRTRLLGALVQRARSTPELVTELAENLPWPYRQVLSRYGNDLRILEERGLVSRVGWANAQRGGFQSRVWEITAAGVEELAWRQQEPSRRAQARAHLSALGEQRRARQVLLNGLRQQYGPATSRQDRLPVVAMLRQEGCTLEEIAQVFGVTRQMISIDTRYKPKTRGGRARTAGQRFLLAQQAERIAVGIEESVAGLSCSCQGCLECGRRDQAVLDAALARAQTLHLREKGNGSESADHDVDRER
jgi:hypothetical protein